MDDFVYTRAASVGEALHTLQTEKASRLIAGGTNLLDLMKEGVAHSSHLIDVNRLPLAAIEPLPGGGVRLGALSTNSAVASHPQVVRDYPLLAAAILAGASPQLRNMATTGGNLLQRTRCYYFNDPGTPCNKRQPGSGCPARRGLSHIHAILGASEACIAVHPSDMCVALAALEAVVQVQGGGGVRTVAFADFHRLPGEHPELDTTLGAGEMIVAVDLPPSPFFKYAAYTKVRERSSYAFALVSAAVAFTVDKNRIGSARLALGGVAAKPWRSIEAEAALVGAPVQAGSFDHAAEVLLAGAVGCGGNDYKIPMAKRAVVRAFHDALQRGGRQ